MVIRNRSDNTEAAERFGAVAHEFCSIVDSAPKLDKVELLTAIYVVLPRLINEAIGLPKIETPDEDDAPIEPEPPSVRQKASMTDEQWGLLYNSLKEKLGDWDLYWQVFDPTTDKEAVCGTLADDIADIYRDLKEGLVLKETLAALPDDIIWEWRLRYYFHWGKHALDALLTIHFWLQPLRE